MSKCKKFKIKSDTFPFDIRVIICKDVDIVAKYVNKRQHRKGDNKATKEAFANAYGMYCKGLKYQSIIWLRNKPKTARQHATISHEVLHAVFECLDSMDIQYCQKSEEAFTYLHSHLLKQILRKCGLK